MIKQEDILLLNLDQLRVLSSVACNDVMSAFHPFSPRSARDVGEQIERSPASVSEHVEKLLEVGLLIKAGTRKKRSRTEQLYLPAGKVIRFRMQGQSPAALDAYMDRVRGKLKSVERNFSDFLSLVPQDETILDFLLYKTYTVHLDREAALRLKIAVDDLLELLKTYAEAEIHDGTKRYNFMAVGLPTAEELRKEKKKPI